MGTLVAGAGICAVSVLLLREMKGATAAALCSVLGCVLLFGAFLRKVSALLAAAMPLLDGAGGTYAAFLLQVLGVAWVAQFGADMCRDCGCATLGGYVETVGRAEILLLALPLLEQTVQLLQEVLV